MPRLGLQAPSPRGIKRPSPCPGRRVSLGELSGAPGAPNGPRFISAFLEALHSYKREELPGGGLRQVDIGFPTTPGTTARAPAGSGTTYLITGGAGFIGSHLTEAFLGRGDRVIVLDDLRPAHEEPGGDGPSSRLLMVTGSIRDELVVDELNHECDVVVHLAAAVGVRLIIEEPLRSFTTDLRGSEVVIRAAHRYQRPILIASTSEVYGKNGHSALTENADRILGPTTVARWAYSTAKAVDEILALTYHRERGLPAVVTRLFNTVGRGQSAAYGMVILPS